MRGQGRVIRVPSTRVVIDGIDPEYSSLAQLGIRRVRSFIGGLNGLEAQKRIFELEWEGNRSRVVAVVASDRWLREIADYTELFDVDPRSLWVIARPKKIGKGQRARYSLVSVERIE